jgi:hypothetical protein
LYDKVNSGEIQEFVHPIFGSYRAMAKSIETNATAEEIEVLTIDCTFIEDSTSPTPFDFSSSRPVASGVKNVEVRGAKLDQEFIAAGISSSLGSDTSATVSNWRDDPNMSVRRVNLELQSISNKIASAVEEYQLATDLAGQPVWRSLQRLQGEVRNAAQLFQQSQPQIFSFRVRANVPLRVLVANMFGADDGERYEELLRLNDIEDPLCIKEGTELKATSPDTQRGRGLRSV